jgi:EAL domain-containing protein (putative c-di-GMP-specific phosphodiesterase class I)
MGQDRFRRVLKAGDLLFREGEPGTEAYLVETGAIEIFQDRPQGRVTLARLGRDSIFGEMALVGDQTRTASALATERTVLAVVTHEYLSERLAQADPLLRHLLRVTMARSREALQRARTGFAPTDAPAEPATTEAATTDEAYDEDLALKRLRLEQELESALEQQQFQLYFQPIVRLADDSIAGFEALIRWIKPGVGQIPPSEFIWVAEQCDLIVRIGHWAIGNALAALKAFDGQHQAPGGAPLTMSVNLSIRQFADPALFEVVQRELERQQMPAPRLRLEITESLVMSNMDAALSLLRRCKDLGTKLVVDDFGTGYSALSYLHKFPVDTLKLDKSFIGDAHPDGPGMKIVRAIAHLATDLGMETVAEGIENAEQAFACQLAGITCAQGYLYGRPLPFDQAAALLAR